MTRVGGGKPFGGLPSQCAETNVIFSMSTELEEARGGIVHFSRPMDTHLNPRMNSRPSLENQRFYVIVIGGGINGVAIARECARAGRRTLLVEQHDFAAGTTSRATRIIHGGLRYLEHGELGLVRESLIERRRLLQERPHLVHPIHFLLALDQNSGRSALAIRTGLWLYRRLGGGRLQAKSSRADQQKLERLLDS